MNDDTRSISDPDAALTDPVLAELFAAMRAEAERPAPPVGPELSRLLTAGLAGQAPSRLRRVRGATAGLVVVSVVAGGVGAAAAAGHLSQPFGPATGVGKHRRVQLTPDADQVGPLVVVPPVPTQDPTRLPPTTADEAPAGTSARRPAPAATRLPDADDSEDEAEDGVSASDGGGRGTGDGGGSQSDDDDDASDDEAGDDGSYDGSEHSGSGGSGGSEGSDESDDSGDASDPDDGTSHDGSGGDDSSGADSSGSGGSGSGTDD